MKSLAGKLYLIREDSTQVLTYDPSKLVSKQNIVNFLFLINWLILKPNFILRIEISWYRFACSVWLKFQVVGTSI